MVLDNAPLKNILSVSNETSSGEWKISPNPLQLTNGSEIAIESDEAVVSVELVQSTGKILKINTFRSTTNTQRRFSTVIQLNDVSVGTYQLRLMGAHGKTGSSSFIVLP